MLAVLFNSVLVAALLVVAGVFIRGAFRHTIVTVQGEFTAAEPGTRRKVDLRVFRHVVWHMMVAFVLFILHGVRFISWCGSCSSTEPKKQRVEHRGATWERDTFGNWHCVSPEADEDRFPPPY